MKIIYRIFILLSIVLLSAGLYLGYMVKPSSESKIGHQATETLGEEKKEKPNIPRVSAFDGDKPLHILVLGIDETKMNQAKKADEDISRSDTMMLFTIDPVGKRAQLLSIPRDTYVNVPGHGMTKINHAYAYGKYPLAEKTVERFLNVKIDHHAIVNYDAVRELTIAVGGVEVYLPVDYKYTDPSVVPPLKIDFKAGYQLVKGDDAIRFLRIRKIFEDQDIGRIGQQQKFLMSLFKKMKEPSMIWKLPKLLDIVDKYVETDLTYGQIADLSYFALSMDMDNIETCHLEGEGVRIGDLDYWKVDKDMARKTLRDFLKASPEKTEQVHENGEQGEEENGQTDENSAQSSENVNASEEKGYNNSTERN